MPRRSGLTGHQWLWVIDAVRRRDRLWVCKKPCDIGPEEKSGVWRDEWYGEGGRRGQTNSFSCHAYLSLYALQPSFSTSRIPFQPWPMYLVGRIEWSNFSFCFLLPFFFLPSPPFLPFFYLLVTFSPPLFPHFLIDVVYASCLICIYRMFQKLRLELWGVSIWELLNIDFYVYIYVCVCMCACSWYIEIFVCYIRNWNE